MTADKTRKIPDQTRHTAKSLPIQLMEFLDPFRNLRDYDKPWEFRLVFQKDPAAINPGYFSHS